MLARELNEVERKWLERNELFVNQDYVKETALPVCPHILPGMAEKAPHSLAELINSGYHDASALPDMECLTKYERELIRLTFVENCSLRKIAEMSSVVHAIGGTVVVSSKISKSAIERVIIRAIAKLKLSHSGQNVYK